MVIYCRSADRYKLGLLAHAFAPICKRLRLRHRLAALFFAFAGFFPFSGVFGFCLARFSFAFGTSFFGGPEFSGSFSGGFFDGR